MNLRQFYSENATNCFLTAVVGFWRGGLTDLFAIFINTRSKSQTRRITSLQVRSSENINLWMFFLVSNFAWILFLMRENYVAEFFKGAQGSLVLKQKTSVCGFHINCCRRLVKKPSAEKWKHAIVFRLCHLHGKLKGSCQEFIVLRTVTQKQVGHIYEMF